VIVGIFKMHNRVSVAMANQAKVCFDSFGLLNKIITYVKDEGFNLFMLTIALTTIVSCSPF
jgi:hypothetical protein